MGSGYHRENLRAELIERGRGILLRDGYAQFSLRKLAAELGVSHTAPYRHFASREELLGAIVRKDMEDFDAALRQGVEGVAEPYERLYRLGEAYVHFFLDNPEVFHLFSTLPSQVALQGRTIASLFSAGDASRAACAAGEARDANETVNASETGKAGEGLAYPEEEGYELLAEAIRPFQGRFAGLSEREIILGYWAKVHGLASLLVSQKGFLPEEDLRERIGLLVRTPF